MRRENNWTTYKQIRHLEVVLHSLVFQLAPRNTLHTGLIRQLHLGEVPLYFYHSPSQQFAVVESGVLVMQLDWTFLCDFDTGMALLHSTDEYLVKRFLER